MKRLVVFLFSTWLMQSTLASTDYHALLSLIENRDSISEQQLKSWQDHLLFPHLWEAWLTKHLNDISVDQANEFLNHTDTQAAAHFFRPKWRSELVRREAWHEVTAEFAGATDASNLCWYLEAQAQIGQSPNLDLVEQLWFTGRSQPDQCDRFFALWLEAHSEVDEVVWRRQLMAFYSRNGRLLRYLNRFYENTEATALGNFLVEVYDQPKAIIDQRYNPESAKIRELALAAVNRMAYQDPQSASNLWLQIVQVTPGMTQPEIREASRYLGIAMAKQAIPQAWYWLEIADPNHEDEDVQHWLLQNALASQDHLRIVDLYQQSSPEIKASDQWRYWLGVALLQVDGALHDDNPLHGLSLQRSYYGYLAAGVLGKKPALNAANASGSSRHASLLSAAPVLRAQALFHAGFVERAQVEWNLYLRNQPDPVQLAAAELALEWGWYAKATQAAGWSRNYDLLHLRYPSAFSEHVESHAASLDMPTFWIYGVMRQESRFEPTALSHANAHGLMQILPATAKQTAERFNLDYSNKDDLFEPETNIAIGTQYLRQLYEQFQHPVFATAAYNAGPSRVRVWRERFPNEMSVWIESIPFDETRNYVKFVLTYSQVYALKRNYDWHLSSWTTPAQSLALQ